MGSVLHRLPEERDKWFGKDVHKDTWFNMKKWQRRTLAVLLDAALIVVAVIAPLVLAPV